MSGMTSLLCPHTASNFPPTIRSYKQNSLHPLWRRHYIIWTQLTTQPAPWRWPLKGVSALTLKCTWGLCIAAEQNKYPEVSWYPDIHDLILVTRRSEDFPKQWFDVLHWFHFSRASGHHHDKSTSETFSDKWFYSNTHHKVRNQRSAHS